MKGVQRQWFSPLDIGARLPVSRAFLLRRGLSLLPMFPLFLVLALLFAQQLAFTHGYRHLPAGQAAQAEALDGTHDTARQGPQSPRPAPAAWHDCGLCIATGGLHLFAPPPAATLPTVGVALLAFLNAVPPAPTFSFPAAYLSRAPPASL